MATSQKKGRKNNMPRASVSLPPGIYSTLEQIAQEKKVSLAWVIRDAAEKYIEDKWPLFRRQGFSEEKQ